MAKLSAILDQVDAGTVLLPEFQRGYVWNRDQVRGLMRSLYKGYPVGALLVWETDAARQAVRGAAPASGTRSLLLDGQQRVTTLYGVVRGTPPAFFEGDPQAFRNLRFNVETEAFEFYGPVKMKDDPLWVDVTALFAGGPSAVASGLQDHPRLLRFRRPPPSAFATCSTARSTSRASPAPTRPWTSSSTSSTGSTPGAPSSPGAIWRWRGSVRTGRRLDRRCVRTSTGGALNGACSSNRTGCCATSTRSPPAVRRSPPSRTSPPRSSATRWGRRSTTSTTSST